MEDERLLSLRETANHFGRKPSWFYNRTRTGQIPYYKMGKYCMFKVSEVMNWLREQQEVAAQ